MRWPDETPDVHEMHLNWPEIEARQCAGMCGRCGHGDHKSKDCPHVTRDLLKAATT